MSVGFFGNLGEMIVPLRMKTCQGLISNRIVGA